MTSTVIERARVMGALVCVGAFLLGASATQRIPDKDKDPSRTSMQNRIPTLTMHTDRMADDGQTCGVAIKPARGRQPEGTRSIVGLRVVADRPVSAAILEQALLERAQRHCAHGLSVLSATAAEDPRRFLEMTSIAWDRSQSDTIPPKAGPTSSEPVSASPSNPPAAETNSDFSTDAPAPF